MTTQAVQAAMRRKRETVNLLRHLRASQLELDTLVLGEPTGDRRNKLTDANLHLMSAIADLESTT